MPTIDERVRDGVRDVLGNQLLQIIQLQAQQAELVAQLAALTPPPAETPAPAAMPTAEFLDGVVR